MSRLPDTTTPKPTRRPPGPAMVLASAALLAAGRFAALVPGGGAFTPRVYLRVEDLPPGRLTAAVERSGRASAVSRLFGERVRADGGGEERLSVSEGGVSGVVAFEVRAEGALPAGEYTVEVRSGGDGGALLARKYFLVGDRQA